MTNRNKGEKAIIDWAWDAWDRPITQREYKIMDFIMNQYPNEFSHEELAEITNK